MRNKNIFSLSKIAEDLGVSKGTVSLVLNGKAKKGRISEELEERIKKYCKAVNYMPNIHARRLNSKFVHNVGILLDQYTGIGAGNPFDDYNTAQVVGGIAVAANNSDYRFSIQIYYPGTDERKVFDWFRNREIDGLIYYGLKMPEFWVKVFREENRKVVGIGTAPIEGIGSVNVNNFELAREQALELIHKGCRNFMYFKGTDTSYPGAERFKGFKAALDENGIFFPDSSIIHAEYREDLALEAINNINNQRLSNVDAITCANDYMAIGVVRALQARGIAVPGQIAVAGADNISLAQHLIPSLSTYDNKPAEQGGAAFQQLLLMLNNSEPEDTVITSQLIWRNSTSTQ